MWNNASRTTRKQWERRIIIIIIIRHGRESLGAASVLNNNEPTVSVSVGVPPPRRCLIIVRNFRTKGEERTCAWTFFFFVETTAENVFGGRPIDTRGGYEGYLRAKCLRGMWTHARPRPRRRDVVVVAFAAGGFGRATTTLVYLRARPCRRGGEIYGASSLSTFRTLVSRRDLYRA